MTSPSKSLPGSGGVPLVVCVHGNAENVSCIRSPMTTTVGRVPEAPPRNNKHGHPNERVVCAMLQPGQRRVLSK